MPKILSKRFFSDNVAEIVVEAPLIARSRRAGHFVMVRVDERRCGSRLDNLGSTTCGSEQLEIGGDERWR